MFDAIGFGQMFQFKAGQAIIIFGPNNTFWAQGIAGAHHIQQIPTGISPLPTVGIRIIKITIENVATDFIIKTNIVVAEDTGAGYRKGLVYLAGKLSFIDPVG
ncbi:hypothetical [Yersinia pestis KIM10+]|uniref:Uncharacterized protein n=1 Tax=Yersinia pestis TaxID=632 RepID=Q8CKY2_YERPE|nr:hypothetical [Yersinia pestis KIM10+]